MSKISKKISKALKKINKQNGGQKMTAKAKKQKLNGKNIMKHSLENKSFTLAGSNVRIEYQLITPEMAANMLENNYDDIEGVDTHLQSQCEKAIFAGLCKDENTNFLISVDDGGLFMGGEFILAAIVEMNEPAVVAFAYNIPEDARVLVDYSKEGKERYTILSDRALEIKDKMEHVLAEFYQVEQMRQVANNIEFDSGSIYNAYDRIIRSHNFLARREYGVKVANCEDSIRMNTLGVDVEWFAACWMIAELNGKDAPFFHAIAHNKPKLCSDAKKYMERSKYWFDNISTMSDESFKNTKAAQKIRLKCYAEDIYTSWINECRKAS